MQVIRPTLPLSFSPDWPGVLARLALCVCLAGCSAGQGPWDERELAILESLSLQNLPALPQSPSNRFADLSLAKTFGRQLFHDPRFSANGKISCASCHQPDRAFTDGQPRAVGVNATGRNTMGLHGAAWQRWFYWDGRKDSLWSQALIPFEAADEMASTRVEVLRLVGSHYQYREQYEAIFGSFPEQVFTRGVPDRAGPLGDEEARTNWRRIPPKLQQKINRGYANLGKAIAAYQRSLVPEPAPFDRYVEALLDGQASRARQWLSPAEVAGLRLFIDEEMQCLRCHNGPLLSNGDFHRVDSANAADGQLDFGRLLGLQAVVIDEFNCLGPYSDANGNCPQLNYLNPGAGHFEGAFKTPSLRYLRRTGPYFHDGRYRSLADAITHYTTLDPQHADIEPVTLDDTQVNQLTAFLLTLSPSYSSRAQ